MWSGGDRHRDRSRGRAAHGGSRARPGRGGAEMNAEKREGSSRAPGLEQLRLGLSNPGTFDEGVEAARNACVAGAPLAAAAITAAAWYDNPFTGPPALRAWRQRLGPLPLTLEAWLDALVPSIAAETDGACFSP